MNIINKLKKEPRMIFALVNFISFFFPWISVTATVSTSVMGQTADSNAATSMTGFGLTTYTMLGIIFYLIPIILLVIPFIKQIESTARYLYLVLPVIALILMFMIGAFINSVGGSGSASVAGMEYSTEIDKLVGYWIALICNIGIIIFTLMKDYNIKSSEDLKKNIQNIDVGNLTAQVSTMARDIGSNVQKSVFVVCPQCGNKVAKGKKFCSKCGTAMKEETKTTANQNILNCSACGAQMSEGTKFCPNCGGKVEQKPQKLVCSNCGTELEKNAKFCPECGTKTSEE